MKQGFTLVELLFIIAIGGLLLAIVLDPFHKKATQLQPQDEMTMQIQRARDAKAFQAGRSERLKKFSDFCGGEENVWIGSDSGDGRYGVFGCQDYSKVPDANL